MTYSNRKVGGIRFVKLGRLQLSFCVTKAAPKQADRAAKRPLDHAGLALDGLVLASWVAVAAVFFS
jgi:hypothetical protein